jgi:hypothetical protein
MRVLIRPCGEMPMFMVLADKQFANSPNVSKIQIWRVKKNAHSPSFFPLLLILPPQIPSCFLIWPVTISNYTPLWRVSTEKKMSTPLINLYLLYTTFTQTSEWGK